MANKSINKEFGTLLGTNAADTLSVRGNGNKILAEGGADTITVYEGHEHTIFGRYGGDTVTITTGAGDSITVYGDTPEDYKNLNPEKDYINSQDIINVGGGSGHKIYGGAAGDTITLRTTVGNGINVFGGSGADIINVNGGSGHAIEGDQGPDKITLGSAAGEQIKVHGGTGEDIIIVNGEKKAYIYGDAAKDTITINAGYDHYVNGGTGYDVISVKGGNSHTINGHDDNDTIILDAGDKHYVMGGKGADVITINKGDKHNISGESGTDTITVNGGNGHYIFGGEAKDTVIINAGDEHYVHSGTGYDVISVKGGNRHFINGYDENDTITIDAGDKHEVYGGKGADIITINNGEGHFIDGQSGGDKITIGKNAGDGITISDSSTNEDETDTIVVEGGNYHVIDAGNSFNNIRIKGGKGHYIKNYADAWSSNDIVIYKAASQVQVDFTYRDTGDTIVVNGGKGHVVSAGGGHDTITVWGGTGHTINGGGIYVDNKNGNSSYIELQGGSDYAVETASDSTMWNSTEVGAKNVILTRGSHSNDQIYVDWTKDIGTLRISQVPEYLGTYKEKTGAQDRLYLNVGDISFDRFLFSERNNSLHIECIESANRVMIEDWFADTVTNTFTEGIAIQGSSGSKNFSVDYIKNHLTVG